MLSNPILYLAQQVFCKDIITFFNWLIIVITDDSPSTQTQYKSNNVKLNIFEHFYQIMLNIIG